jgi:hypothetical protein
MFLQYSFSDGGPPASEPADEELITVVHTAAPEPEEEEQVGSMQENVAKCPAGALAGEKDVCFAAKAENHVGGDEECGGADVAGISQAEVVTTCASIVHEMVNNSMLSSSSQAAKSMTAAIQQIGPS